MASKDSVVATKQKQDVQKPTPMGLGISTMKPKFPQYALPSKRQESFTEASIPWPQDAPVGVEKLVEAGLVYTGVGDSVRCYHCGGGLRNWEEGDDPMEEHAKWYPTCQHVLIAKGKTYIRRVEAGENPKTDSVDERKKKKDTLAVVFQTLAEFGYSENEAKIALNIFRVRKGMPAPFKAANLVLLLMEIEDDPDVMNEYNGNIDATPSMEQPCTEDAEGINENREEEILEESGETITESVNDQVFYKGENIKEENKNMMKSIMCKRCKKKMRNIVFLPCGHLVVCEGCAPLCVKICFICKTPLEDKIKALWSCN